MLAESFRQLMCSLADTISMLADSNVGPRAGEFNLINEAAIFNWRKFELLIILCTVRAQNPNSHIRTNLINEHVRKSVFSWHRPIENRT